MRGQVNMKRGDIILYKFGGVYTREGKIIEIYSNGHIKVRYSLFFTDFIETSNILGFKQGK
jgi:hypothetical protein